MLQHIDDADLCRLYNQAAAFVYPSLYEGFGIPLLEAMACGCPIIASQIPSTAEVAADCPIYFAATDEGSLLEAMDIAVTEGRNSARVHYGLERARRYSWDMTARKILETYQSLIG